MKYLYAVFAICFFISFAYAQNDIKDDSQTYLIIKPNNKKIVYQGRVETTADSTSFYWPGTSISVNFRGNSVAAKLKTLKEDTYFYVIIDDSITRKFEVPQGLKAQDYVLANHLSEGKHQLQLFKLSNSTSADYFYGFSFEKNAKLLKPNKLPKRKIEFYGNSITAGHGVDVPDSLKDSGEPKYFNNYYTYAAITARHFNAQYVCTARSGIGVTISWFPEIMPETYNRIDPLNPNSKWDFNKYQPDVIVVNLFQNDSWLVNNPAHPEFKHRFGNEKPSEEFIINAYKNLITEIRANNPKAQIICALGNMDATKVGSPWPSYIQKAADALNDDKIYTVFFPYKNTDGHPKRLEQKAMATQLIDFIDHHIKW